MSRSTKTSFPQAMSIYAVKGKCNSLGGRCLIPIQIHTVPDLDLLLTLPPTLRTYRLYFISLIVLQSI